MGKNEFDQKILGKNFEYTIYVPEKIMLDSEVKKSVLHLPFKRLPFAQCGRSGAYSLSIKPRLQREFRKDP